jgi:[ribosomal protein S5]-alanine N-acetyltransferase
MGRPRVYLRAPQQADAEEFVGAMLASRALHRPWAFPPTTREAFAEYIERLEDPTFVGFLICRRDNRAIVGHANLSQIFYGPLRSAYLGYNAVAAHAGRGYMTEGLLLVLRRAFGVLALHRVEANIQPGNVRSRALIERCGFSREGYSRRYLRIGGRWRDHERWALLAEDFGAV